MNRLMIILCFIFFASCNQHDDVELPFAGVNSGLTNVQMKKNISKKIRNSSSKILKKLDSIKSETNSWELTRLSVGLFFVFESELTNVYKVEVEPSVELRYQQL